MQRGRRSPATSTTAIGILTACESSQAVSLGMPDPALLVYDPIAPHAGAYQAATLLLQSAKSRI